MSLEYANTNRSGGAGYRRKIKLLGKETYEDFPPVAIARAMRKNSELGEMERRLDDTEKPLK